MCQLLFSESANPPKAALVDANVMNKDGFGMAWVKDKNVHWNKGFEAKQLDDEVIDYYFALPFPKAIHFRLATHGGTTPELTHPFPIKRGNTHDLTGTAKAVLFHNGVWNSYDDRLREAIIAGTLNPNVLKGGMSDSRAMAVLAQRFGVDILDILELGSNKVLLLTDNGFTTYGSWTEKEGWSASNSRIFRAVENGTGKRNSGSVHSGVALGPTGLPLTADEKAEFGRKGYLNRHGNLRERFRTGRVHNAERDMGTSSREMDAQGESVHGHGLNQEAMNPEHQKTDTPTQGSLYLSATVNEIRDMQDAWGSRERMN